MIERLNGRDFVDADGDVRTIADIYDGMDDGCESLSETDRVLIENAMTRDVGLAYGRQRRHSEPELAGQEALFPTETTERDLAVHRSVLEHPSLHAIDTAQKTSIADDILARYRHEVQLLRGRKVNPDYARLKKETYVAVVRSIGQLTLAERELLRAQIEAKVADQDYVPRERDFRERQFKDD